MTIEPFEHQCLTVLVQRHGAAHIVDLVHEIAARINAYRPLFDPIKFNEETK